MKVHKVIVIVIIVVALNNILLLSLLGYYSDGPELTPVSRSTPAEAPQEPYSQTGDSVATLQDERQTETTELDNNRQNKSFEVDMSESAYESEVAVAVKQFVKSKDFEIILDDYQLNAIPRYEELQRRFKAMTASELLTTALDSSKKMEQKYAQQMLVQGKLGDLESHEMKALYQADGVSDWVKQQLLPLLLEDEDSEAVAWAKQSLSEGSSFTYQDREVYAAIYETDPDFIVQHINSMSLDDGYRAFAMISFVTQDEELLKNFYSENFDRLLESKNGKLFQYLKGNNDLELSNRQQSQLAELFESKNRHKRAFAIRQVKNIDDVNVLRDSFSRLRRTKDQRLFLQMLSQDQKDPQMKNLIQELAEESQDPQIRKFLRR